MLRHTARGVSAAQLSRYPALLSLSDNLCAPLPLTDSLLTGLSALSCLQHLALSQCAALFSAHCPWHCGHVCACGPVHAHRLLQLWGGPLQSAPKQDVEACGLAFSSRGSVENNPCKAHLGFPEQVPPARRQRLCRDGALPAPAVAAPGPGRPS